MDTRRLAIADADPITLLQARHARVRGARPDGVHLDRWAQEPRPYQEVAIRAAWRVPAGGWDMLSSPTGTGKGTIELATLCALVEAGADPWIVTPSLEVIRGYLERCGASTEDLDSSTSRLHRLAQAIRVTTPVRLRNRIAKGTQPPPTHLLVDEAHHAVSATVAGGGLAELCPGATWVGYTATPYRGTPEETEALRDAWGPPTEILSIPQAVQVGAWALPTWRVEPLVDDDDLTVRHGELAADEAAIETVEPLTALLLALQAERAVPTVVAVPCVDAAGALRSALDLAGCPAVLVVGETPAAERAAAYAACREGAVLVAVRVLGEGVDLPWLGGGRIVDCRPTLSPVAWLQLIGRCTRPGAGTPEVVVTNRNLERHGYLLQGALPRAEIRKAQEAFGGASARGARAGILKGVGRAEPIALPLADGVEGTMWALYRARPDGGSEEACYLVDPTQDRVLYATRTVRDGRVVAGPGRYGRWARAEPPSAPPKGLRASRLHGECSPKQLDWWRRDAVRVGLDADAHPSRAQFWALPVLLELRDTLAEQAPVVAGEAAEPAPRPEGPVPATWARLPDGTWGARPEAPVVAGDLVAVRARDGRSAERVVASVLQDGTAVLAPEEAAPAAAPAVPDGYYTIVREDGSYTTIRVATQDATASFFPGRQLLSLLVGPQNTADYRRLGRITGRQLLTFRNANGSEDRLQEAWAAVLGDPSTAGKAWALESGRCYRCGRLLTTPESIAAGIGPVCGGA